MDKLTHTPGAWEDGLENHVIFTHGINIPPSTVMRIISEEDYQHGRKCVTALQGIEDPEGYRKESEANAKDRIDLIFENNELLKYKAACEAINKENPLAVADNLKQMHDLLNEAKLQCDYNSPLRNDIEELLTKIQHK